MRAGSICGFNRVEAYEGTIAAVHGSLGSLLPFLHLPLLEGSFPNSSHLGLSLKDMHQAGNTLPALYFT